MSSTNINRVTIRKACASDQTDILTLIARHRSADARQAKQTYTDFFASTRRRRDQVFVAVILNKIVGVSGYWYDGYTDNGVYWLNWTYVDRRYHSQGIGDKLLRRVFKELRGKRTRKLYVDTSSRDSYRAALRFYLQHGFRLEGILRDYYEPGEDQIILGKELRR
jgi:ribosomal protein S18 acetylase RimI-like enzyme